MKLIKRVVVAFILVALVFVGESQAFFGFGKYKSVDASNGEVRIDVADVSDGQAHYYKYEKAGREVKFFVLKSSDGVIRAAFDACDVCFAEKNGYDQDGDFMICNNCGQKFHSARINEVKGGCNPSPLHRELEGDQVVIKETDIFAGSRYF